LPFGATPGCSQLNCISQGGETTMNFTPTFLIVGMIATETPEVRRLYDNVQNLSHFQD
jgi:hypothetical protein